LAMMPNTGIMHKENLIAQTDVWSLQFGPQKSPSLSLCGWMLFYVRRITACC
jgi:hypothetical protein